ncbi:MAG TPA: flagellar FlbD family protein [Armatimonadota bacterium]|nr:flagellar FlbD family protein [Armatimonadota bacterium]HOJ20387.1 flagellar FlbD family protein [Armatimonadota bacterium]HOM81173.1 flagellar FlbD family protein [Armatimonadota bacterium]HOQ27144.1 flagellar FlbD family protein [Armatimonadota bacterium]HPO73509.1 flagellar FlbD family protein [Armatimonadota bacterium]
MIHLTRLDSAPIVVNCDLVESIEATPDTLLSLTTGKKILVKESVAEVVEKVVAFKRLIAAGPRTDGAMNAARDEPARGTP